MTNLVKTKKTKSPSLNKVQSTFNRLRKAIKDSELRLHIYRNKLEAGLRLHYEVVDPKRNELLEISIEIAKIMYTHYKNSRKFSKKEKKSIRELIEIQLNRICDLSEVTSQDPELLAIIKDIEGVDVKKAMSEQMDDLKDQMKEMFGADIDLSNINPFDKEEIFRKIAEALSEAKSKFEEREEEEEKPSAKPKSKKELERESKAQTLQTLQNKSLNTIYKSLAKVFHPDLEQDKELKIEKGELMKKLTTAYEEEDLHTLLLLEMEWINRSDQQIQKKSDDELKIYNSILKEQLEVLEDELAMIMLQPQYRPLGRYAIEVGDDPFVVLHVFYKQIMDDLGFYQPELIKLQKSNSEMVLRDIIRSFEDDNLFN